MPSPAEDSAIFVFSYAISQLHKSAVRSGQPWKFLIPPFIFAWNKTDSFQLSTVNATKTPEAR